MESESNGHERHAQCRRLLKFHAIGHFPRNHLPDGGVLSKPAIIWSIRGIAFDGSKDSVTDSYIATASASNRYNLASNIASKG